MATSEAMEDVQMGAKRSGLDMESLKFKKFKAEDLPLSSAQHASIDKLLHSFKKKGGFDSIRKKIWADFNDGEFKTKFTDELIALAESEIEREPAHLSRERGKAATLIEGAVDRSDVYKNVEVSIDKLTSNHLESILDAVREIRRQEIGDEAAAKEEEGGKKTDAEFEAHVQAKREERDAIWREEMRKQKEIDDEQKRIRDEERRKKRELERQKEDEERAKRKEIDDQRRAEREREREEQRALDDKRERELEERYQRRRRDDRERYRDYDRWNDYSPAHRSDRGLSPRSRDTKREKSAVSKDATPAPVPVDEKSLEEAALQMLLKEGEELAAKARQKPDFDFEKAEALESGLKLQSSDSKLVSGSTRATSISRDSRPRESISDRRDRTRPHTRDRSRSRSRRRRRDRSRDISVRSRDRDRDMDERRGFRDFRDSRDDRSYRPSRRSRSRSAVRERDRDRDRVRARSRSRERDSERRRDRSRDRDREYRPRRRSPSRRRSRSRSRSRNRVREARSRSRSNPPRRRSRSRSTAARRRSRSRRASRTRRSSPARRGSPSLDIDRYVPSTSNRSKSPRRRARSPEREQRSRLGEIDRYIPASERDTGKEKEDKITTEPIKEADDRSTRRRSRSRRRSPSRRRSRTPRRSRGN
ncbi:hypothetical protein N7520_009885 [Penicillium odoratum]|uniref:uncharacterized protein n=1 Tax=Penicillium odoratum TaxID=1167516 RepID=UPI002547AF13|nr:uncharacterized protein N7520_009885 [Penicillium odoratum]KAJ5752968.1 hypothetical protein N7520_009885 [Penicillium odoratum]